MVVRLLPWTSNVDATADTDTLTYTLGGADAASFRVLQDNAATVDVDEDGQIDGGHRDLSWTLRPSPHTW